MQLITRILIIFKVRKIFPLFILIFHNIANEIAENLKHLASFRTDIFGGDEKQAIKKLKETREKAKQKEKNIWDGIYKPLNALL